MRALSICEAREGEKTVAVSLMKFSNLEEGTEAQPPGRKSELVGKLAFGSSEKKEEMLEVVFLT